MSSLRHRSQSRKPRLGDCVRCRGGGIGLRRDAVSRAEAAAIWRDAVRCLVRHDPGVLGRDLDALGGVARRLGVSRSTLGTWISPRARQEASVEGLRRMALALMDAGARAEAAEFLTRLVTAPIGLGAVEATP